MRQRNTERATKTPQKKPNDPEKAINKATHSELVLYHKYDEWYPIYNVQTYIVCQTSWSTKKRCVLEGSVEELPTHVERSSECVTIPPSCLRRRHGPMFHPPMFD